MRTFFVPTNNVSSEDQQNVRAKGRYMDNCVH